MALWDKLIQKQAVYLDRMPPGWNAGAFRREREEQYGRGLVVVGGGEGVEHSARLYMESGKPVISIDLPIPSRHRDGVGGAQDLSRRALSNPVEFIGSVDNGATRLAGISAKNGKAPIEQICPRILQLLSETVEISEKKKMEQAEKNPKKVFVVHGRNEKLRGEMFSFLRSIGLEPIEWTEAVKLTGSASPYVSEILDAAFSHAQAVVVLLTPDDEARLCPEFQSEYDPDYEKNFTSQARPNVIFEAGMALGRHPDRTILVEVGKLKPFSDIVGRHTIRLDDTTEKRQALAMRLRDAGCKVNLNGTDWHKTGNFQLNPSGQ